MSSADVGKPLWAGLVWRERPRVLQAAEWVGRTLLAGPSSGL